MFRNTLNNVLLNTDNNQQCNHIAVVDTRRKEKNKLAIIAHTFPLVIFSSLKSLMSIDLHLLQQHLKILVQTTQHPRPKKGQITATNNLYTLYAGENVSLVF